MDTSASPRASSATNRGYQSSGVIYRLLHGKACRPPLAIVLCHFNSASEGTKNGFKIVSSKQKHRQLIVCIPFPFRGPSLAQYRRLNRSWSSVQTQSCSICTGNLLTRSKVVAITVYSLYPIQAHRVASSSACLRNNCPGRRHTLPKCAMTACNDAGRAGAVFPGLVCFCCKHLDLWSEAWLGDFCSVRGSDEFATALAGRCGSRSDPVGVGFSAGAMVSGKEGFSAAMARAGSGCVPLSARKRGDAAGDGAPDDGAPDDGAAGIATATTGAAIGAGTVIGKGTYGESMKASFRTSRGLCRCSPSSTAGPDGTTIATLLPPRVACGCCLRVCFPSPGCRSLSAVRSSALTSQPQLRLCFVDRSSQKSMLPRDSSTAVFLLFRGNVASSTVGRVSHVPIAR